MKRLKSVGVAILLTCIFVSLCIVVIAEPGTDSDPLISKSYIDEVLMPKIQQYVDDKIAEMGDNQGGGTEAGALVFEVVEADAGDKIICSAGAELILRMGKATIIATEKGGLADTTIGYDLADGTAMPANHMLIVPVADGRGIKADTDIIVMIKGEYIIK